MADSTHFASRLVVKHEPRLVVVYAGDNDLAAGKTPEQVTEDFKALVAVIHKDLPKTRIVFLPIKPSIARWKLIDKIRQANSLVQKVCEQDDKLTYVDTFTPMLGEDAKPRAELFAKDGLHLNEKGYALWSSILKPILTEKK
jgi:lysophospholipase L1-like esterase